MAHEITVVDAERIIEHMNTWLIAVKIKHQNFSATIACVYHSPNSCHRTFVERLNAWLQERVEADEKILLFGDMNIDWLTNSANKNRLHNSINDNGLTQMINKFTRITDESNTLVDYCITNMNNLRVEIKPELNISDHECIVCEILNTNNFSDTKCQRYQRCHKANKQQRRSGENYTTGAMRFVVGCGRLVL